MKIDEGRFQWAHEQFERYIFEGSGVRFTSFDNPFFRQDEIDYKVTARTLGRAECDLQKWKSWLRQSGQILKAVRRACAASISRNLLEHRWGGPTPLSSARTPNLKIGLERCLYDLFTSSTDPDVFGRRFDALTAYLQANRLGCDWSFVAYLAFLANPSLCFPIRPSRFDRLLRFYGIDEKISKRVTWERYGILFELADELRTKLAAYGSADNVAIQSYMWVVSRFVNPDKPPRFGSPRVHDPESELQRRLAAARERERIGCLGEYAVVCSERDKLAKVGRVDLARRVAWISCDGDEHGYDVLSFHPDGREMHIEVKSTAAAFDRDTRFWLSDFEKRRGEKDECWTLYRVSDINAGVRIENLGNIVTATNGWQLSPASWCAVRTVAPSPAETGG